MVTDREPTPFNFVPVSERVHSSQSKTNITVMKINPYKKRIGIVALSGALIVLAVSAFGLKGEADGATAEDSIPALEVKTVLPLYEQIVEWDEYTGRFEASSRAEVRARVGGFLEKVNFTHGQYVQKGQVLFVIDQRPYRIELDRARANYAQAVADLKTARDNFERVAPLQESGAVSEEEYQRRQQAVAHAQAGIQLAQAQVDQASLNLEFTEVKAPISGLAGRELINRGNLVDGGSATSSLLTTIVSTSPIHFYFTGSESDYLKYVRLAQEGKRGDARTEPLSVQIKLADEEDFTHQATLDFVDNGLDPGSGTIEIRAVLANRDHLLEPGMFGKARLEGSGAHHAIMVPGESIGTNQALRFVYVMGECNQVQSKNVTLGPLHSNGLRIIREGIDPDDRLITNNLQKIGPGMVVTPKKSSITVQGTGRAVVH